MDDITASLAPELLSEILLRLPPDEPGHLFRAALVCKEWLRAICDPGFLRRYRAFHGSPPLLGLLHRRQVLQGDPVRHLARTTAVPLFPDPTFRRALDCHHGRALLHASDDGWYLIVWDPVTGEQHRVPEPGIPWLMYTAAVFCAVSGCPFRVVFVATDDEDELVKASVYSSETGAWSKPAILDYGYQTWQERLQAITRGESYRTPYVQPRRGALVGDEIYFTLRTRMQSSIRMVDLVVFHVVGLMDRIEVDALEDCNVDSESSSDSELDDLILRMHRKEVVHEIKRHLKKSYDFHTSKPHPTAERRISFKEKLDSALGSVLPLSMKEKLCSLMEHHCSEVHAAGSHTCEDVLIDALVLVAEDSVTPSDKVQNDVDDTNTEGCNAVPSRFDDNADVDASIPDDVVVCTPIENDPCVNSFVANGDDVIASGHAAALISSSNRDFDYELLTPKSAFVKKFKYCADHNLAGSASATIAASIHNVAKKFKTRFPELLNQNARDNIIDFSRPSFKLLDSEDDVSSSNDDANNQLNEEDNQAHGDITPPSSLLCKSFRSVPDSIDVIDHNNIRSNENSAGINQISSIFSNRVFQDVTNSPDVVFLGENKFPQTVKESCVKTEEIYNATNNLSRYTHGMSSSGGKLPAHGPRRIIVPSRHASDPFVPAMKRRFLVSDQENRYYIALCRLADSSKWQSYDAVDIDNVRAKFSSFGHSLKKTGVVLPFVMSVFCRFLFQNNHPSKSKKHYFFPSIGAQLILDPDFVDQEKVKKSFLGAASARPLHLCDMLFFPILHGQHWFVLVVDIKDRMLVFLDSLHQPDDEFFEPILPLLLKNLQIVWDKYERTPMNFSTFKIKFPPVPRQEYSFDSGIFSMKFMEIWSPRIILSNQFTGQNINNIRVQYANQMFFHPNNKMLQTEVENVGVNWFDSARFPSNHRAIDA
ncbi:hypothetical protein OsJ_26814 [Oryza sativa Japonica Group]|uniref:Ubiquitin-like protease family profile domain-containing protein n=1 Tax=Oryza sativa subsp. japonica TaxID=39947 RepID=A3BRR1_ORYSJ|nr:hypothetical protein OsJ_26814 [Oryza sativa Japonica Group]